MYLLGETLIVWRMAKIVSWIRPIGVAAGVISGKIGLRTSALVVSTLIVGVLVAVTIAQLTIPAQRFGPHPAVEEAS